MNRAMSSPIHVYVHFPWCLEKCPYCDFVSFKTERESIDHDGYAEAVVAELHARAPSIASMRLSSIFLGGGTPSLWEPRAIAKVIGSIRASFPVQDDDVEITSECNPTSLDGDGARALVDAGITRFSVGAQSLDPEQLRFLGRLHDPVLALAAIDAAVATGVRASADLIFGLPKQRPEDAAAHALSLVDRGLNHLSAYALTIEPGTRFGELARRGRLPIAEEDSTCDAFLAIEAALASRGLEHYEVSNYARPGHESRHNLGYWRGADYLGLGCAAYGALPTAKGTKTGTIRYRNDPDPARYVAAARAVNDGLPALDDGLTTTVEPLDAQTLLRERIMLGLRLREGVDLDAAGDALGLSTADVWTSDRSRAADAMIARGDLVRDGGRISIAPARRLSTDGVAMRLF